MYRRRSRGFRKRNDNWRTLPDLPAGQHGRYKHNGRLSFCWRSQELEDDERASIPSCLSIFADLYRHHAMVFARYRADGRFTPKQLRTIEALYIEGLSLREFALVEGVEPQAISARIDALANKALEFYRWWRRVNAGHQRPRRKSRDDE